MTEGFETMLSVYLRNMRERNLREATREKARQDLARLFPYLEHTLGLQDLRSVNGGHLTAFREHLANAFQRRVFRNGIRRRLSRRTQTVTLAETKRFFRFLAGQGLLAANPAEDLEIRRDRNRIPRKILTESEAGRILNRAASRSVRTRHGILHRAILELLYGSGIRSSELRFLKISDADLENGLLFVNGKGGRDRVVPMTTPALVVLKDYLSGERREMASRKPAEDRLFLMENGRPLKKWYLGRMIAKYARAAGISDPVSPHSFRHACATHLLARGAALRYVQELLGHAWICTTEIYTHVFSNTLKAVYEKTHPHCVSRKKPRSGRPGDDRRRKTDAQK